MIPTVMYGAPKNLVCFRPIFGSINSDILIWNYSMFGSS